MNADTTIIAASNGNGGEDFEVLRGDVLVIDYLLADRDKEYAEGLYRDAIAASAGEPVIEMLRECLLNHGVDANAILDPPNASAAEKAMPRITVIDMDDWAGLYVDGRLVFENHRVEPKDMAQHDLIEVIWAEGVDFQKHVESAGGMPKTLEEARTVLGEGDQPS